MMQWLKTNSMGTRFWIQLFFPKWSCFFLDGFVKPFPQYYFFFHKRHFFPLQLLQSFPQMTFLDETFKETIQVVKMCNLAPSPTKLPRGETIWKTRRIGLMLSQGVLLHFTNESIHPHFPSQVAYKSQK